MHNVKINHMFSGIVKDIGEIKELRSYNGILDIVIESKLNGISVGDSVSVDGCCLTITSIQHSVLSTQLTNETLEKTKFKNLKIGSKINLEPSLKLGDKLDGHLVSGHVDCTGKVLEIITDGENKIIKIEFPENLNFYIANKGSICVNGVSLTVIEVKNNSFTFTLIPYTLSNTNLGLIKIGDLVNLEVDLISRYLVNYMNKTKELEIQKVNR